MENPTMRPATIALTVIGLFYVLKTVESLTTDGDRPDVNKQHGGITYSREELLAIADGCHCQINIPNIPDDIKRRRRKRGRRGGVRMRCRRRGSRLPMPMVVCGNARSIRNKIDELTAMTKWNYPYREASMIVLTETWLQTGKDPDSAYSIDGFSLVRGDRTEESGKSAGGGVCVYINNRWCKNYAILEQCCHPDIEYLCITCRPFYLPREFPKIFVTAVYIPPSADIKDAETMLYDVISKIESDNPDAVNIITGDFNSCMFDKSIPNYVQYIHFPTRSDKVLDPFFCNVKHAYVAKKLSPLGISDHNMCHLIPIYRQRLKTSKPTEKLIYTWNDEVNKTLLGCMEATDFDVLYDENASIDYNVDVLNSYIAFCIDHIVPRKLVKCFPNNKPWVTKELKPLLNKKKYLLSHHDRDQLKIVQKEINAQISVCKQNYKTKIENLFKTDSKSAWAGLRGLTGMSKSKNTPDVENPEIFCNELNKFFARFDTHDFSGVRRVITNFLGSREAEPITVTEEAVSKSLRSVKIGKAAGPDGISSSVIKLCW